MEAMAYLFTLMVLAGLIARFGRQLVPGRAGLVLQIVAAALSSGLAIRTAGVAMDQVEARGSLFLVVVVGMLLSTLIMLLVFDFNRSGRKE